ncbi:MAG: CoA activase [Planctomycetes bacterium]|nr:CoA activase [Planctomycetota bacterium]
MSLYIGLDVGSISVDVVVMNEDGHVLDSRYVRVLGRPHAVALEELENALDRYQAATKLCVTGSGAKTISELLEAPFVNEIIAHSKATAHFHPEVRTIIEIGGSESKLIHLQRDASGGVRIADFAMNPPCAAGTGSFIDQQASRLKVSIEEFSRLALRSEHPPRVAGRCSVFAKSDMIHLQQQGAPDYDIIAGLCYAMARNFKASVGMGKEFISPIAFQGGVAANAGIIRAFKDVLNLQENELVIPEHFNCMGAIGAVLHVLEDGRDCSLKSLAPLRRYVTQPHVDSERLPRLQDDGYQTDISTYPMPETEEKIDAYIGVDVGSISTNVVALDAEGHVLARRYLMTEGRPIEAVKKGLYEVGRQIGDRVTVRGCATTGSGRYLTGAFIGADIIKNEITTHARAAVAINPRVDTIFEIGGQDAKYISLENGAVVDFAMNKVCAAGTGSFLEEQAERLDLKIEEEFGAEALSSAAPCQLGERCTVFMESDLNFHQQRGMPRDDLVAGLCYSIVYNYLNRVVEDRKVGDVIFFQGGVAFNRGVKAAFEAVLGRKVLVPPQQDILGAIGAALIAREERDGESDFRGFDLRSVSYELETFECHGCSNRCEIHKVSIEGRAPLYYGSRCGKYDEAKEDKKGLRLPDLFAERRQALLGTYPDRDPEEPLGVKVGIPRVMTFFDLYPFWKAFFTEIGCQVVLSEPTNRETVNTGAGLMTTETCLPIITSHGHVARMLESDVDYVFVPSVINLEQEARGSVNSYTCPLAQGLPYLLESALQINPDGPELLAPIFHFAEGRCAVGKDLKKLARRIGAPAGRVERATRAAWRALDEFRGALRERGHQILEGLADDEPAVVVISRPYNGCDPGINLAIPEKLKDLGVLAIPLDFLPLDLEALADQFPHMYWKYGQKILAGAKYIAGRSNLHALYITNFRCGPDSFISKFFSRLLGRPYLTIEVDQHSADVGAITRCEAFIDGFKSIQSARRGKAHGEDLFFDLHKSPRPLKIYIPHMLDHGILMAAVMRSNGIDAEPLPISDNESLELGRQFTTGKECYPCILTTGDIVKKTRDPDFDPDRAAFFMPQANGPCRFGQYHKFHRMVLDELGYEQVPMVVLDQTTQFSKHIKAFGPDAYRKSWDLLVIVDYMQKLVRQKRPYELNEGETDSVYSQCMEELVAVVESKGDYFAKAREIRRRLQAVPTAQTNGRPIIGVVGEIYVRSNDFANNFLVRKLEALGAQVVVPTLQEWVNYIAHERRQIDLKNGALLRLGKEWLVELVARWDEGRAARAFSGAIDCMPRESPVSEVIKLGAEYLDPTVKGEAILSIGRAVEYAHHGLNGIVNVTPFGCMPGALVDGLLEKFRRDYGAMPSLKLAFDGTEQTAEETLLEAFVHQAQQHMESQRGKGRAATLDKDRP